MKIRKFNEAEESWQPSKDYDYEKVKSDFDDVVNSLLDIIDEFDVELKFETACGHRVGLTYEEYARKGDDYKEFIEALPVMGEFFTVILWIRKMNYPLTIEVMSAMVSNIEKIKDLGWEFKEYVISGTSANFAIGNKLEYKFDKRSRKEYITKVNQMTPAYLQ